MYLTLWLKTWRLWFAAGRPVRRWGSSRRQSSRPRIEQLEDRLVPSATLAISSGALAYAGSAVTDNTLTVSSAGNKYTFHDSNETITLGAGTAGWSGSGTNTVTGPESSVTGMITINAEPGSGDVVDLAPFDNTLPALTISGGDTVNVSALNTVGAQSYSAALLTTLSGNLTTSGGAVSVTGPAVLGGTITINSTSGKPAGANVTFTSTLNDATAAAQALTVTAGTSGTVTFGGVVGGTKPLASLTASGKAIAANDTVTTMGAQSYSGTTSVTLNGNLTTAGGAVAVTGPATLGNTITINTASGASAGAGVSFSSTLNDATAGAQGLTVTAGLSGAVDFNNIVGGTKALASLTASGNTVTVGDGVTTAGVQSYSVITSVTLSGNLTTAGATVTITGPAILGGTTAINTTSGTPAGANVTFSSALTDATAGAAGLTVTAGTGGTVTFNSIVGGTKPLAALTASGETIVINDTVTTKAAQSYTATTSANLNGNLTTAGGSVTVSGPAILGNTITIDTASGAPAGGNVTFGSTVDANTAGIEGLTVVAGTSGAVDFTNIVGGTKALASLTVSGKTVTAAAAVTTTGAQSYRGTASATLAGTLTTTNSNLSITSGSSVGTNGTPLQVNIGTGKLNLSAGTGGVFINATTGNFSTSSIAKLSVATSNQTIALSTTNGTITLDSTAGFASNTDNDNFILTTHGANMNIAFSGDTTLTTRTVALTATGAITHGSAAEDIVATSLTATAAAGIGALNHPLATQKVTNLAAFSTTGGVYITNTN